MHELNFSDWIDTLWEEKGYQETIWMFEYKKREPDEIFGDNVLQEVNNKEFLEVIKSAPPHEQAKIKENLVMIDFRNGDCMHFIHYLAKCYYADYHRADYIRG